MNDRLYLDQKQHEEPQHDREDLTQEPERDVQHRRMPSLALGAAGRLQRLQMHQVEKLARYDAVADFLQAKIQMRLGQQKTTQADAIKQSAAKGLEGASTGMPFQQQIQKSFGKHDISSVRSVTGGTAEKANTEMGSLAYASGDAISFKQGPSLHTAAHEAAHIVQQRGGVQLKSGIGQVGDQYEVHADQVADLVVQGKSAENLLDQQVGVGSAPTNAADDKIQQKKSTDDRETSNNEKGRRRTKRKKKSFRHKHGKIEHSAKDDQLCPNLDFGSPQINQVKAWYSANFGGVAPSYAVLSSKKSQYVEAYKKWQGFGGLSVTEKGLKSQVGSKKNLEKIRQEPDVSEKLDNATTLEKRDRKIEVAELEKAAKKFEVKLLELKKLNQQIVLTAFENKLAGVITDVQERKAKVAKVKKYLDHVIDLGTGIAGYLLNPATGTIKLIQTGAKVGSELIAEAGNLAIDNRFAAQIHALKACVSDAKNQIQDTKLMIAVKNISAAQKGLTAQKVRFKKVADGIRSNFKIAGMGVGKLVPGKKGRVARDMIKSMPFIRELAVHSESVKTAATALTADGGLGRVDQQRELLGKLKSPEQKDSANVNDPSDGPKKENAADADAKLAVLSDPVQPAYQVAAEEERLMAGRGQEFTKLAKETKDAQKLVHEDVSAP